MSWFGNYRCNRCGRKSGIIDAVDIRCYNVCNRGDDFDFCEEVVWKSSVGWCRRCSNLQPIENIPPLEDLRQFKEKLIQDLQSEAENDTGIQRGRKVKRLEDLEAWIENADALIRWRKMRVSPAKCFRCASTFVKPIPSIQDFIHPGCGGKFQPIEGGHANYGSFEIYAYHSFAIYPAEGPEYHPPTLVGFFRDFFCPAIRDIFG